MPRNPGARKCKATKAGGQPCGAYAIRGGAVCAVHGGRAPRVKEAARGRLLQQQAQKELIRFSSAPAVSDPFAALLRLAGEAGAWKAFCEDRVQSLHELRYSSSMLLEQQRSEVAMYQQAMRLSLDINATVAKLDCEDRLARIQERTAEKLCAALDRAAAVLEFTPDTRQVLWREYARELRALQAVDDAESA